VLNDYIDPEAEGYDTGCPRYPARLTGPKVSPATFHVEPWVKACEVSRAQEAILVPIFLFGFANPAGQIRLSHFLNPGSVENLFRPKAGF